MRVLVTGAQGFIGKNLIMHLNEQDGFSVLAFCRNNSIAELHEKVGKADAVIHENRPRDTAAFETVNAGLTQSLCDAIRASGRKIPLVLASSIQANQDNPYPQVVHGLPEYSMQENLKWMTPR